MKPIDNILDISERWNYIAEVVALSFQRTNIEAFRVAGESAAAEAFLERVPGRSDGMKLSKPYNEHAQW